MAKMTIDGRNFSGNNISIKNGVVTIDGVRQDGKLEGVVELRILEGIVENIKTEGDCTCMTEVKGNVDAGMGVEVKGSVGGYVKAGMAVTCGAVGGDVKAGMDVKCDTVGGSVDAGMGVSMRK